MSLPLFENLPRAASPTGERFVLASSSPRRKQLMEAAGYEFTIIPASDSAECGMCSRETAPEMVARYAYRKAADVARKLGAEPVPGAIDLGAVDPGAVDPGAIDPLRSAATDGERSPNPLGMIIAADTVASCVGQILGKPRDAEHAESMLRTLSGRRHDVYSGLCLWSVATNRAVVEVVRTELEMLELSEAMLEEHLDSMLWEGKAGAFGFQDGNDWLRVIDGGCQSNVVGLPMPRLAELLENFDANAELVNEGLDRRMETP